MVINTDINILGGLPDWDLVSTFLKESIHAMHLNGGLQAHSNIKTDKSIKRFERAITSTLLKFHNHEVEALIRELINAESLSNDSLQLIFWNASFNNDLLKYLNDQVYFVSFYSGSLAIKQDEVVACLKDLREREPELKKWSDSTLQITASKYLTLLKKFNLMDGSRNKIIVHPYINDKMFVLFVYWMTAVESKSNLLESEWLKYSFCERTVFIERLAQKRFAEFFHFQFTGDKLKIETTVPYSTIYHVVK